MFLLFNTTAQVDERLDLFKLNILFIFGCITLFDLQDVWFDM